MDFIVRSVSFVACTHRGKDKKKKSPHGKKKSVERIKLSFNFTQSFFLCGYKKPIKNNNNNNITHWIISRKFVTMNRFSGFLRFESSPDADEEVKLKVQMIREKLAWNREEGKCHLGLEWYFWDMVDGF